MNIGKKAILLTAAAGTLVIGGAGGALAYGNGDHVSQSNKCDTETGLTATGGFTLAPTGDVAIGSDCINFTNTGAVSQSNDCDTSTGVDVTGGATLAPEGDLDIGSNCANIAIDDRP
ncbi:hypothetical protein SSOG_04081 [Streptomyces himastatinicus ATCC 53653]|uniref:Chaplin domain-containing protein n=1 Tax=Streptomyces himastatinicus ATCC 53653 TaxID=457427 RepID=D9WUD2_9ACTN|nr:hypothetical protein [Streptomyces himastatinicus]EFL24367.1 hypothetical protein SSOG_04081 [Streptomyces himastatinicus ATCC 53653]